MGGIVTSDVAWTITARSRTPVVTQRWLFEHKKNTHYIAVCCVSLNWLSLQSTCAICLLTVKVSLLLSLHTLHQHSISHGTARQAAVGGIVARDVPCAITAWCGAHSLVFSLRGATSAATCQDTGNGLAAPGAHWRCATGRWPGQENIIIKIICTLQNEYKLVWQMVLLWVQNVKSNLFIANGSQCFSKQSDIVNPLYIIHHKLSHAQAHRL